MIAYVALAILITCVGLSVYDMYKRRAAREAAMAPKVLIKSRCCKRPNGCRRKDD